MIAPQSVDQRGSLLITVLLILGVLAAMALMLSSSTSSDNALVAKQAEGTTLDYLAESGMAHAQWRLAQNTSCANYSDLASRAFEGHAYEASVSPTDGSPVTLSVVAVLSSGATRTLTRSNVKTFLTPESIFFQPGPEGVDAEIWDQSPDNNYGSSDGTWVSSASNDTTRSLLRFSLGEIPTGAKILDARLSLLRQGGSGTGEPVSAHRIRTQWSEDSVTWNSRDSLTNWDSAGGDFDITAVTTTAVGSSDQRSEWNITPLVQGWVTGSYVNHGVELVAGTSGISGVQFYTSDESRADKRPSLSVTYACECGKTCVTPISSQVLFVVKDDANLSTDEELRKAMMEAWDYTVTVIDDSDSQAEFDAAVANVGVAYISETVQESRLGTKLVDASIGVVTEKMRLVDEFGFAQNSSQQDRDEVDIVDTSHYITSPFFPGLLTIFSNVQPTHTLTGTMAAELTVLGEGDSGGGDWAPSLAVLDVDALLQGGGTAAGRRVKLPWGDNGAVDIASLNEDGQTILRRALEWAAQ